MKHIYYNRVISRTLPNLHVATVNGQEVGFLYKPEDTATDKNYWRSYVGIGEAAKFIGHSGSKQEAMRSLTVAI